MRIVYENKPLFEVDEYFAPPPTTTEPAPALQYYIRAMTQQGEYVLWKPCGDTYHDVWYYRHEYPRRKPRLWKSAYWAQEAQRRRPRVMIDGVKYATEIVLFEISFGNR